MFLDFYKLSLIDANKLTLIKCKFKSKMNSFIKLTQLFKRYHFKTLRNWGLMKCRINKYLSKNALSYLQRKFRVWMRVTKFEKRKAFFFMKVSKYVKLNTKRKYFMMLKLLKLFTAINNLNTEKDSRFAFRQIKNYSYYKVATMMLANYLVEAENNIYTQTVSLSFFRIYYFKVIKNMIENLKRSCFKFFFSKLDDQKLFKGNIN